MSLFSGKRKSTKGVSVNFGKKGNISSVSQKIGPLTINSKGTATLKIGKGKTAKKKLF